MDKLLQKVEFYAEEGSETVELFIPYNQANLIPYLYEKGKVIEKEYKDENIYVKGKFNSIIIGRVKEYVVK